MPAWRHQAVSWTNAYNQRDPLTSFHTNVYLNTQDINPQVVFEIHNFDIIAISPRRRCVKLIGKSMNLIWHCALKWWFLIAKPPIIHDINTLFFEECHWLVSTVHIFRHNTYYTVLPVLSLALICDRPISFIITLPQATFWIYFD